MSIENEASNILDLNFFARLLDQYNEIEIMEMELFKNDLYDYFNLKNTAKNESKVFLKLKETIRNEQKLAKFINDFSFSPDDLVIYIYKLYPNFFTKTMKVQISTLYGKKKRKLDELKKEARDRKANKLLIKSTKEFFEVQSVKKYKKLKKNKGSKR